MYNEFVSCKESGFLMANDRINELTVASLSGSAKQDAVLACQVKKSSSSSSYSDCF